MQPGTRFILFLFFWPFSEWAPVLFGVPRPPEFERWVGRRWVPWILAASAVLLVAVAAGAWWMWKMVLQILNLIRPGR